MEILFEIILTMIVDVGFEIINNNKLKMIYRVITFIAVTLFYIAFIALFTYLIIIVPYKILKLLFFAIIIAFLGLYVRLLVKLVKARKRK